jgi:hypothetical protein
MDSTAILIPIIGLILGVIGLIVLTPRLLRETKQKQIKRNALDFSCPTCQNMLVITRESIVSITGVEAALVVQNIPNAPRHHLAEQRCLACSSMLTFRVDQWPPVFLIANAVEGQKISNNCVECRQPLVRPRFARGVYDGRIEEIPELNPKLGLKCSRCDAVSCVECLEFVTRNRTKDGSFLCPRCFRSPVNLVHHF